MANLILIAKAKATGKAMKNIFGIEPEYDIRESSIKIYYPPDRLQKVQKIFDDMTRKKSNMEIQWLPIITPHLIKNYAPILLLAIVAAYVTGKIKQ